MDQSDRLQADDPSSTLLGRARAVTLAYPATQATEWRLEPVGAGRIHTTYLLSDERPRFLLQRVNTHVFTDAELLCRNVDRVSRHIGSPLRLERSVVGELIHRDEAGKPWRLMRYVEASRGWDGTTTVELAGVAGTAFGEFCVAVSTLDPGEIEETIPGFHDTPARYARLERAMSLSGLRGETARDSLAMIAERRVHLGAIHGARTRGEIPTRVAHNDAKLDNLLFHERTGEPIAVVDLDTVMPGSSLYDLGDLVRTAAATAGEEEREISRVDVNWHIAVAAHDAFCSAADPILSSREQELSRSAGWILAMEQGIRFLTDFLEGDRYYRVAFEEQNLVRAKNQLALARGFEREGWWPGGA